MIIELLLPSLLTALLIAIAGGTLGCFVVWRRMAFFSDALAHSAVLGTALALIIQYSPLYGLLGYGTLVALLMARFETRLQYSPDTLLAILSQASLAVGLLLLPLAPSMINIETLLFGDILAVNWQDVITTAIIAFIILLALWRAWPALLALCIDEELAATEGVNVKRTKLLLFLLLVALVAIAVQMVGALLVSALLLIPAAIARRLAATPLQMLCLAPLAGVVAVCVGLFTAYNCNTAAGPTLVISAASLWLLSLSRAPRA